MAAYAANRPSASTSTQPRGARLASLLGLDLDPVPLRAGDLEGDQHVVDLHLRATGDRVPGAADLLPVGVEEPRDHGDRVRVRVEQPEVGPVLAGSQERDDLGRDPRRDQLRRRQDGDHLTDRAPPVRREHPAPDDHPPAGVDPQRPGGTRRHRVDHPDRTAGLHGHHRALPDDQLGRR